jgi:hypothetical protein
VNQATGNVTVSASIGAIQTPWLQNIGAAGFNLTGAGSITGSSITTNQTTVNGQLYIGTTSAPVATSGLATLYFNGTSLYLSQGTGPFYVVTTTNNSVASVNAGTGISVSSTTGAVSVSIAAGVVNSVTYSGSGNASISGNQLTINFPTSSGGGGTVTNVIGGTGISVSNGTTTPTITNTGVLNYNPGIQIQYTAGSAGVVGIPTQTTNGIYVYNSSGGYVGMIPII